MSGPVTLVAAEGSDTAMGTRRPATTHGHAPTSFYGAMSGVLLLVVLTGFSRTLYLRSFFDVPPIPTYVLLHGVVLTAWFGGLFLQATLVYLRRTRVHRRLGWIIGGIGLAVVAVSWEVTLKFVPRQRALGVDIEGRLGNLSQVVWVDLAAIVVFAVFLTAGVLLRRRGEWHKRLMLIASISIVSPAMSRMWRLVPGLSGLSSTSLLSTSLTLGALVLLLAALVVYDTLSHKRVHPATLVGAVSFLAVRAFAGVFADSPMARSFVRGLE